MISKKRLQELSLFLNIDLATLTEMDKAIQDLPGYTKWSNLSIYDWDEKRINQKKRGEIEKWFLTNDKYLFELSDVHSRKAKQKIINQVLGILKKNKVNTVLDYGGGIGEEALTYAQNDMNASMADLPSVTFEFAKWRSTYNNAKIEFIEVKNDQPLKKIYDAITCFEVIQHLYNPKKVVKHIVKHIKTGGLFILTTHFNNPGYSMALRKNYSFKEGLEDFMKELGLAQIEKYHQYGNKEKSKFLYVYKKQSKIQNE